VLKGSLIYQHAIKSYNVILNNKSLSYDISVIRILFYYS
jgi:hypothetical protein